jgi:hypothetical protein
LLADFEAGWTLAVILAVLAAFFVSRTGDTSFDSTAVAESVTKWYFIVASLACALIAFTTDLVVRAKGHERQRLRRGIPIGIGGGVLAGYLVHRVMCGYLDLFDGGQLWNGSATCFVLCFGKDLNLELFNGAGVQAILAVVSVTFWGVLFGVFLQGTRWWHCMAAGILWGLGLAIILHPLLERTRLFGYAPGEVTFSLPHLVIEHIILGVMVGLSTYAVDRMVEWLTTLGGHTGKFACWVFGQQVEPVGK